MQILGNFYGSTIVYLICFPGASSGIGAGTAVYFAKLGSKLALNGRNEDNLKEVVKQCEDVGLPKEKVCQTFCY